MEICSYRSGGDGGGGAGREKITYDLCGEGNERRLIVRYDNEKWGASCREMYFKRHGREIDVTFVISHVKGPSASLPVIKEVAVPLPDELYFMPNAEYKMKKVRLNVYTKKTGEREKLRCCRELDHYVPEKTGLFERLWHRMTGK